MVDSSVESKRGCRWRDEDDRLDDAVDRWGVLRGVSCERDGA